MSQGSFPSIGGTFFQRPLFGPEIVLPLSSSDPFRFFFGVLCFGFDGLILVARTFARNNWSLPFPTSLVNSDKLMIAFFYALAGLW